VTKREELAKKGDKLLNDQQEARMRQLNAIERLLFQRLITDLAGILEENNGRISSRKGPVSIAKAIDAIFDKVEGEHLGKLVGNIAGDMQKVLGMNANHYRVIAANRPKFDEVADKVGARMRQRLGIDKDGAVMRKGYLDNLLPTEAARNEVKQLVQKSIAAGIPMRKLTKALSNQIAGTDNAAGVLEKNVGGYVMGAYRMADSIANNEFGERLGLGYGIYSGGLIETSREFCKAKNGKVFTVEEANRDWPVDPLLPRSKAEKEAYGATGAPAGYVPLEDMGRWEGTAERCRHRFLRISEEEALRRRPDLRPQGTPSTKPKAKEASPPPDAPAHVKGSDLYKIREEHRETRSSSQYKPARAQEQESLYQHQASKDGPLTTERAALHKQIIADAVAGVPKSDVPTLYMMGGGPASGKSTIIKQNVVTHPTQHVLLNPDEFKEDLPEYREGIKAKDVRAAAFVHEESSLLNKAVGKEARERGQDIVWDGTGDGTIQKLRDQIAAYRAKGYRVKADYVTTPTEVAVERVYSRGMREGRFVPLADVRNTHREVSRILPLAVAEGLFDEMTLWDTSTDALVLVARATGKNLQIVNQALWQVFLNKGKETYFTDIIKA